MNRNSIAAIGVLLICSSIANPSPARAVQAQHKPSRDDSTQAIRATAREMMKAFLTVDVATFKRHSAKRTLDLVGLVFQAAQQEPRYQQEMQKANITNA